MRKYTPDIGFAAGVVWEALMINLFQSPSLATWLISAVIYFLVVLYWNLAAAR